MIETYPVVPGVNRWLPTAGMIRPVDKEELIRLGYDTVRTGDLETAGRLLTPRTRWHSAIGGAVLGKPVYVGPDEIIDLVYREIPSVLEGFRPEILEVRDLGGDLALAVVRWCGTIRSSGLDVDQIFGQLCQVRDGKWLEMRSYESVEAAEAAIPEVRARHGYEDWNRGDIDAVVASSHPDVVFEQDPGILGAETIHGHDALRAWLQSFIDAWEDFELEPERVVTRPDGRTIVILNLRATARSSGARAETRIAHVITLRDGLVHTWRSFTDPDEALR